MALRAYGAGCPAKRERLTPAPRARKIQKNGQIFLHSMAKPSFPAGFPQKGGRHASLYRHRSRRIPHRLLEHGAVSLPAEGRGSPGRRVKKSRRFQRFRAYGLEGGGARRRPRYRQGRARGGAFPVDIPGSAAARLHCGRSVRAGAYVPVLSPLQGRQGLPRISA